ncbi:hypothetical protein E8D34_10720 [Nocardioides sp. GY 10113]|uniref:hypothetical protein n=1 Tax=Nocardioides sp. GY 10113 TaxID=2569761 RepID=UPI0010A90F1F|nr:hypothetical protein [Nocardioides sp. GY 10113]TIC86714.1 hypothetical protein E8D34_10720 [Nocardioides sp. GY 10113]
MFIIKVGGRSSMELTDSFRSYEQQLRHGIGLLDGGERSSYLLFHVPDDAGWPDAPGFNVGDYDGDYLQCAGTAGAMVIEVRRLEADGRHHQYALGRPTSATSAPSVEVDLGGVSLMVSANEVFDADEAVRIFLHYFESRSVPDTCALRELDLH